jgi:hypothetical protein
MSKRFGVRLEKIPEQHTSSPDFVFRSENKTVFFAELKDITCDLPSEEHGWIIPKPGEPHYPWSFRDDNAVSRVASKIHESYLQLMNCPSPRVLIILNYDSLVDVKDLQEAYEGRQLYSNEVYSYYNIVSKKIADGRIKQEKQSIDLYIWIDKSTEHVWFRFPTQSGFDLAHNLFKQNDRTPNGQFAA